MKIVALLLALLPLSCATPATGPSVPPAGKSTFTLALPVPDGTTPIECFTYKPARWQGERMLFVLHGTLRNADEYRDHAVGMGDRFDALIVAPRFDKERFPSIKYQRGGILREDGTAASPQEWTYALIPKIAAAMRQLERKPDLKFWIIGHSAGGQFAMRMSGFQDTGAERIVAANPGTDLFPTREFEFGWGFGKLPDELSNDDRIRRYLAAPLTLYLGTADDHEDEYLDMSPNSVAQGPGRLQRGRAAFALGEKVAREHGWPFHWRLVEAEGVPHDHELMFANPACARALFGPR